MRDGGGKFPTNFPLLQRLDTRAGVFYNACLRQDPISPGSSVGRAAD